MDIVSFAWATLMVVFTFALSKAAEYSFHKGLFDPIVPRNPLKGVLSELFQLHGFFPLNQNSRN